MGCCTIAGKQQGGYTQSECTDARGSYKEKCSWEEGPDKPNGDCLMAQALPLTAGEAVLTIGLTYQHQVSFREHVLKTSVIGKRMMKLYYEHKSTSIGACMFDLELLALSFGTWMRILNFVRATAAVASGDRKAVPADYMRLKFTPEQHARVVAVMERMRANTSCEKFHKALSDVQKELEGYVGMTPEAAVQHLRRKDKK